MSELSPQPRCPWLPAWGSSHHHTAFFGINFQWEMPSTPNPAPNSCPTCSTMPNISFLENLTLLWRKWGTRQKRDRNTPQSTVSSFLGLHRKVGGLSLRRIKGQRVILGRPQSFWLPMLTPVCPKADVGWTVPGMTCSRLQRQSSVLHWLQPSGKSVLICLSC